MSIRAWWFAPEDRRLQNEDGRLIRRGQTHIHKGPLALCKSGLHASRQILDALQYAPGPVLCRVECDGDILEDSDKLVCSRRKYLAVVDATELLRKFARLCALDVLDKWDAPDVVRRYLRTGSEELRAAAGAAAEAAGAAAGNAAGNPAWAAARAAAGAAAGAAAWPAGAAAGAAAWPAWAAAWAAGAVAWAAAGDAAWAAARAAAGDAAWAAAGDAAWAAQNRRLHRMAIELIRRQNGGGA